jgi:hypothetical protein
MAGFSFLRILPAVQAEPVSSMLATTESKKPQGQTPFFDRA